MPNKINNLILGILCFVFAACETTPKNPEAWMEREINACLPTAIAFREGLRKYQVWARVFSYRYYERGSSKPRGHAMVAYLYPSGKNKLWTYDNWGSWRTKAFTHDVLGIAQYAHVVRGGRENVISAEWID